MTETTTLAERLKERFAEKIIVREAFGETTAEVAAAEWIRVCGALRDEEPFGFEQMVDLCGVDYAAYGQDEWATKETTRTGYSRGVVERATGRGLKSVSRYAEADRNRRFGVVIHLLSYRHNRRLRLRCFAPDDELPVVSSLVALWSAANWFEREAFDLYGIVFEGHPDLRRILTDYGFVGHPFRKDFPLIGQVEMRYDPERGRVVYQPVTIEPRVLVPRVIRHDHRYQIEGQRAPEDETDA